MLLLKWGCTAKFIASNSIALVASMLTVIRRGDEPMTYHMRGGHTNILNAVVRKTTTHGHISSIGDSGHENMFPISKRLDIPISANDMMVLSTNDLSVNLIQSKDLKFIRFA